MPDMNMSDRMQKIGQTAQEYRDAVINQFKDMEVSLKDWNFSVGKMQDEYNVEVNIKLGIHSKKA